MNDNEKKILKPEALKGAHKPEPRVRFVPFEPLADRPFSHVPDMSAEEFEAGFQAQINALRKKTESESS
jgi:hypothetical protein